MSVLTRTIPGTENAVSFTFSRRDRPLRPDQRLSYRLAVLVCSVAQCHSQRSSFARLALLNYAVRVQRSRSQLIRAVHQGSAPSQVTIRTDPYFPRVLNLATAAGLLALSGNDRQGAHPYRLSVDGQAFYQVLLERELLMSERMFFSLIAPQMSEKDVIAILRGQEF